MMRNILFIVALFFSMHLNAQTGIGTTTPHASAKLDVSSTNKGFLPPRVSLTSVTDNTTIPSAATGLLVYCKGDAGLEAGYYYWNGNAWATIATSGGSGSFAASYLRGSRIATQTIAVGGIVIFSNIDNSSGGDISLNTSTGKITLAPGNTYRLRGAVPNFSGGQRPAFIWYNETSSANVGSATFSYNPGDAAALGAFGAPAELIITPTVSTVLSFRLLSSLSSGNVTVGGNGDFSTTGSYPWFEAQVISGNAPVTGQSVDYVSVGSINLTGVGGSQDLIFSSNFGGNIPYNSTTGVFTLSANKTYLFQAQVRVNTASASGNYIEYGFVDAISNVLLVNGTQTITSSTTSTAGFGSNPVINFIYTPSSNQTVKIRTTSTTTGTQTVVSGTANITQIGSSAIINPWTLSGTNTYNTTGNVGIGTSSPNTKLEVNGTASAYTLSLSNSTIGTPSWVLRNGDASATYSDIAQVKMGWSGSAAGKSQYAQFIHSRHNSGATGNAIDIYLSDGTADNTIITGSTKALSIESPGNLTLAGKINLTDASGNVAVKAASFVNAGVAVTLGDIQVIMSTSGSRSLQIRTTGSSFTGMASAHTTYANGSYTYYSDKSFTVDANYGYIGGVTWSFGNDGDLSVYYVRDTTNQRFYRFTLMVGNVTAYTNNFISIERLL